MMGADLIAITGAAHGIGAALAREAVGRGYRVALFDRDEAALVELRAALGAQACLVCPGDVTSTADLHSFAEMIGRQGGVLRMVFANAGILRAGEILGIAGEIDAVLAELRGQPVADIARQTSENVARVLPRLGSLMMA